MGRSRKKQPKKDPNKIAPYILGGAGLLILAIVGLTLWPQFGKAESSGTSGIILPPATLDQPAPSLTLTDLEGNQVSLSDHLGEVVLVNNWATWCPPCRAEMPELNEYYRKHKNQGFIILAVESGDPETQVRAFAQDLGLEFPVLLDPEQISVRTFQNASLPNTYVIDRKGNLRLMWTGAINMSTLEEYVTPLLKE